MQQPLLMGEPTRPAPVCQEISFSGQSSWPARLPFAAAGSPYRIPCATAAQHWRNTSARRAPDTRRWHAVPHLDEIEFREMCDGAAIAPRTGDQPPVGDATPPSRGGCAADRPWRGSGIARDAYPPAVPRMRAADASGRCKAKRLRPYRGGGASRVLRRWGGAYHWTCCLSTLWPKMAPTAAPAAPPMMAPFTRCRPPPATAPITAPVPAPMMASRFVWRTVRVRGAE